MHFTRCRVAVRYPLRTELSGRAARFRSLVLKARAGTALSVALVAPRRSDEASACPPLRFFAPCGRSRSPDYSRYPSLQYRREMAAQGHGKPAGVVCATPRQSATSHPSHPPPASPDGAPGRGPPAQVFHRRVQRAVLGPGFGRALLAQPLEKAAGAAGHVVRVGGPEFPKAAKCSSEAGLQAPRRPSARSLS